MKDPSILAETQRLILRSWQPDRDAMHALSIYGDPEVTRFLMTKITTLSEAWQVLDRWNQKAAQWGQGCGFWAIQLKADSTLIGTGILIPLRDAQDQPTSQFEVGWHLKRSAWGCGYATEAARALLHYGFEQLRLPTIFAVANPDNTASLRVMQRLHMQFIGNTTLYYQTELALYKLDRCLVY
ncbi:MAG: GNAT family N-acetyltransferase [Cyanobacteriota bacterium]|nr:GNAT family N-acetyltransferase [Cyanobacteriota bacterium]